MNPDKRGNPPFEPSSYAAGLQRRVKRFEGWCEAARQMAKDLIDGDELDKMAAEGWWRQQLDMPQVVLSAADIRNAAQAIETRRAETLGSVEDESAVRQDAPTPHPHPEGSSH